MELAKRNIHLDIKKLNVLLSMAKVNICFTERSLNICDVALVYIVIINRMLRCTYLPVASSTNLIWAKYN